MQNIFFSFFLIANTWCITNRTLHNVGSSLIYFSCSCSEGDNRGYCKYLIAIFSKYLSYFSFVILQKYFLVVKSTSKHLMHPFISNVPCIKSLVSLLWLFMVFSNKWGIGLFRFFSCCCSPVQLTVCIP